MANEDPFYEYFLLINLLYLYKALKDKQYNGVIALMRTVKYVESRYQILVQFSTMLN
jgi:hypothetical protein